MSSVNDDKYMFFLDSPESYHWYYNIKERAMLRLPAGVRVAMYPNGEEDERGRIIVVTEYGDYILAEKEMVKPIGFN